MLHPERQQQLLWPHALRRGTQFGLIVRFNEFLATSGWERDAQLHPEAADHLRDVQGLLRKLP